MRRQTYLILTLVLFFVAGGVLAQAPEGDNDASPLKTVVRYLQLTPEQVEAVKSLLETRRTDIQPLREELAACTKDYQELISSENPDPALVGELALKIHGIREEIANFNHMFIENFKAILEDGQLQRLRFLHRAARLQGVVRAARHLNLLK